MQYHRAPILAFQRQTTAQAGLTDRIEAAPCCTTPLCASIQFAKLGCIHRIQNIHRTCLLCCHAVPLAGSAAERIGFKHYNGHHTGTYRQDSGFTCGGAGATFMGGGVMRQHKSEHISPANTLINKRPPAFMNQGAGAIHSIQTLRTNVLALAQPASPASNLSSISFAATNWSSLKTLMPEPASRAANTPCSVTRTPENVPS
jgi:hypothetical protein